MWPKSLQEPGAQWTQLSPGCDYESNRDWGAGTRICPWRGATQRRRWSLPRGCGGSRTCLQDELHQNPPRALSFRHTHAHSYVHDTHMLAHTTRMHRRHRQVTCSISDPGASKASEATGRDAVCTVYPHGDTWGPSLWCRREREGSRRVSSAHRSAREGGAPFREPHATQSLSPGYFALIKVGHHPG